MYVECIVPLGGAHIARASVGSSNQRVRKRTGPMVSSPAMVDEELVELSSIVGSAGGSADIVELAAMVELLSIELEDSPIQGSDMFVSELDIDSDMFISDIDMFISDMFI